MPGMVHDIAAGARQRQLSSRCILELMPNAPFSLRAVLGDITALAIDAIVNAANSTLLGGGGVDGAIHAAAGPELVEACRRLGGCATGDAKITQGFNLKARYVIHAVGPVWKGGARGEPEFLASCYRRSIEIASQYKLSSLAFPSISTGAYGFPVERAAPIAISTVRDTVKSETLREVIFCCHSHHDLTVYQKLLRQAGSS